MNELACTLIHVRKIFNCRMSFKMLLSMLFRNCWEETLTWLWSGNFRNGTFEIITKTVAEVVLIKVSSPNVASKQKNWKINIITQNTMESPYHSKVRSTQNKGSPTFLMFGSQSLLLYLHVLVKAKFFLKTLTWQT